MKFVFHAENSFILLFHYFIFRINIILSFSCILGVGVNYIARSAERRDRVCHRTRHVNPWSPLLCKSLLNDQSNDARGCALLFRQQRASPRLSQSVTVTPIQLKENT